MKHKTATAVASEESWAAQVLNENQILFSKIMAALQCDREEEPAALREVLRFLSLAAHYEHGQLTPSHRVDLAWHEFILCTRAYQAFCEARFGRMIHHDPGEQHRKQFQETLRCYRQRFGLPDRRFWAGKQGDPFGCGSCETV